VLIRSLLILTAFNVIFSLFYIHSLQTEKEPIEKIIIVKRNDVKLSRRGSPFYSCTITDLQNEVFLVFYGKGREAESICSGFPPGSNWDITYKDGLLNKIISYAKIDQE